MPQVYQNLTEKNLSIHLWQVIEDEPTLLAMLPPNTPYLEFSKTINAEDRRREWLATRVLIHKALKEEPQFIVKANPQKRPILSPKGQNLSISHSNGLAGIITHPQLFVSIDIEDIRRKRNWETKQLFMNPAEIAWFNHSPSQNKFLWIWTAKEVLYKLHSRLNPEISFQKELFIDIDQLSEITDQPSFSATGQFSRGDVLLQNSIEVFRWRHWWVCYAAST